jgi:hypothetical protein
VFRALVSLLVAVPLLMPPGTCLCRSGVLGSARAIACQSVGRQGDCGPTAERGCCRHHKPAGKCENRDQETRVSRRTPVPGCPAAPEQRHEPKCPALRTPDYSKVAGRYDVALVLTLDQELFRVAQILPTSRPALTELVSPATIAPPLYLSHCTLLI